MRYFSFFALICTFLFTACHKSGSEQQEIQVIFETGSYPNATHWQGKYYFTMQAPETGSIILYEANTPEELPKGKPVTIWKTDSMQHIWSPELHRVNSKWYIYFEADNGNTDYHQLYVLENAADNPMKGKFQLKGAIHTNDEWNFGLHPTSIIVRGQQYLLWSGWEHRRAETETQCIFIARMKNPWTLDSERVLISRPDNEWERQWINPNGERSNYPIFVNENPEAFITPDGRHVCVCYSASGIWTVYASLGMLYARTDTDLLNPQSWTKCSEPQFVSSQPDSIYGASNISLIPSADGKQHLLFYEARWVDGENLHRGIRMQPINWNKEGLPDFGKPQ